MRVGIISTVGIPACYGGYESLVENLVTYKQRADVVYQVYCSSVIYKTRHKEYKGATLKYIPLKANGPQGIIYDTLSLIHAYFTCDVIMSLGTVGCFVLPFLQLFSRKKVIVNLDGLDDKREKWNKLAQFIIGNARNIAANKANIVISDNQIIQEYVKKRYKRESSLIEYGGNNAKSYYNEEELNKYGLARQEYAFKVARIEPENKIDMILEAFSRLPNIKLVLVGNWEKSEYGKQVRKRYSTYTNLMLLDPIYENNEINLLRSNCKFYIHGHSAGGTNPSLVEAMNLALPILAFDVSYNRSTTENQALYFSNTDSLCDMIFSLNQNLLESVAMKMKKIAERRYLWEIIACKYERLYN